jgi:hypothetical protein
VPWGRFRGQRTSEDFVVSGFRRFGLCLRGRGFHWTSSTAAAACVAFNARCGEFVH